MKTNGQIAYEANCKAYQKLNGIGLIEWGEIPSDYKDMWEAIAKAVLDAQWKPASERPDTSRHVIVQTDAFYLAGRFNEWFTSTGHAIRVRGWRELPPMPKQEGEV